MSPLLEPVICERARQSRDPRFDGRFYVAVVTTGIFCRPVCPARIPAAEHVRFFPTSAAALDAGYRPCLRCRPERAPTPSDWTYGHPLVSRAMTHIQHGALDHQSEAALATTLGVSVRQLGRTFVQVMGASPGSFARARRLAAAKRLIDDTVLSFTEVAGLAGFRSLRRFNECVFGAYQRSPSALRAATSRRHGATAVLPDRRAAPLSLSLRLHPPYNQEWMLTYLQRRAIPGIEQLQGQTYQRLISTQPGTAEAAALRVTLYTDHAHISVPCAESAATWIASVRHQFDLDADGAAIDAHLGAHALLADTVRAHPGLRVPGCFDPFELAVRAILGQQVTVTAATTLAGRLSARYGHPLIWQNTAVHAFPTPEALASENPAGVGMPGKRGAAIQTLAQRTLRGELRFDVGVDALTAQLLSIPGVGPWTAEYIAMRALRDPDAFPADDIVLRKAVMPGTCLSAKALTAHAEAFRPWRAYAVMYLWRRAATLRENPQ